MKSTADEATSRSGLFDRFADKASDVASSAVFFGVCVLLVLVWAPSLPLFGSVDTWQLVINTATTIITFLMVALLQNSQRRGEVAVQHKLNVIADALADLMEDSASEDAMGVRLLTDASELRAAVGVERT